MCTAFTYTRMDWCLAINVRRGWCGQHNYRWCTIRRYSWSLVDFQENSRRSSLRKTIWTSTRACYYRRTRTNISINRRTDYWAIGDTSTNTLSRHWCQSHPRNRRINLERDYLMQWYWMTTRLITWSQRTGERLLRFASHRAGNNAHDNEMLSIIEELHEAGYIN